MNKILFAVTFFISFQLFPHETHADPISKEEAQEWLERVSRIRGIPLDQISTTYIRQEPALRAQLANMPSSMAFNRDLADNLHVLGHLAEHDHDFPKARAFHLEALELYKKAGVLESKGSANGELHALEHIFMDYYDEAALLVQNNKDDQADELYEKAYEWSQKHSLPGQLFHQSPRFPKRYLGLLLYRAENLKSLTDADQRALNSVACSRYLIAGQTKSRK